MTDQPTRLNLDEIEAKAAELRGRLDRENPWPSDNEAHWMAEGWKAGTRNALDKLHVEELVAEVRRLRFRLAELGDQGPDERETVAEAAQMYRSLRTVIERTMVEPDRWDGDEDESFHLARYVEWLAAGQPDDDQPDTLPAWLYQRFAVIHGLPAWDRIDADDRAYWAHQADAVRRAVARGGFRQPPTDQPGAAAAGVAGGPR